MRPIFRAAAMGMLAAGLIGGNLRADTVYSTWLGGPGVTVKHTTGFGPPPTNTPITTTTSTAAGGFKITETPAGPSLFDAYCVSLNVTVGTGPTQIVVDPILALHGLTNGAGSYFIFSGFADVGNRLEFLLNKYGGVTNSNPDVRAALGLAIWKTIDAKFAVLSSLSAGVAALYNQYTDWAHNGYVSGTVYNMDAKLFVADSANNNPRYQNLIGITPVPEPSGIAIVAGLIGLGAVGRLRARRKTV